MQTFKRISPDQAKSLMEAGKVQIADIRDEHSYHTSHIPGATHVSNHTVQDFIRQADMDQPLLVVCYHGMSSQSAAAFFCEQGFDEVYSLDGGFEVWRLNNPVITGD